MAAQSPQAIAIRTSRALVRTRRDRERGGVAMKVSVVALFSVLGMGASSAAVGTISTLTATSQMGSCSWSTSSSSSWS